MTFPAELVDTIVDKLQDDKSALATCSLLSRIWVPRSRYHLFHSITVTVESDGSGFKPFLDFLRSSPNTIDHIQELTLDGSVDVDWEIYYLSTITQNTSHPLLFQILDYLPALTSLELRCMWFTLPHRWTEEERRIALRGPKRPLALRRLTLCLIGYIGFSAIINTNVFELRGILAAFSSIKELHTSGLMMHPNGIEWPQDNRNKFLGDQREPLSLVIRRCNTLTHIFQSICHIPVESLCVETGEEAVTGNYIKNLGTALKHLDLDFTEALKFFRRFLGHEQCIDFSKSTNLTTIVLWVEMSDLGHRYHGSPWLTFDGTVVNLPSSIQEITVYLCFTSDGYHSEFLALTEQLNWDGM